MQVSIVLLTDIDITMNVGRSILTRYYKLDEGKDEPIYRELQDRILVLLEYVLAPMQAVLPDNISQRVNFEAFIAGRYHK